jgi:hypothetical protein
MVKSLPLTANGRTKDWAEQGWRVDIATQPDGKIDYVKIPLTSEEFLHPQEGYHLPNSTFHDAIASNAKDMLSRRYASDLTVGVFRDLLIEWDTPALPGQCPDVFVAFGIENREQNRTKFIVANEGSCPSLIIEVVSPRYRKEDREIKVLEYAQAGVQEYVIIDRRTQRSQLIDEVLGYRLVGQYFQPISPDDDGRILSEIVGLWISLQDNRLILEDAQTGQRLQTSLELEAAAAEMAARLARYQERFGDLPENTSRET